MFHKKLKFILILLIGLNWILVSACTVGPDYDPPAVLTSDEYKEAPKGWKLASPKEDIERGEWWKIFRDPTLNDLENKLQIDNQNIAAAYAQYEQARALVYQARAAFFPIVSGMGQYTRQKLSTQNRNFVQAAPGSNTIAARPTSNRPFDDFIVELQASWEPDIWGGVRRMVESAEAFSESSFASFASTRLSMQALLAQSYFTLRYLDRDQQLLNDTVRAYEKALNLTEHRHRAGVVSGLDVSQAKTQLDTAKTAALDNEIQRGQMEHAIAVLIGLPPGRFCIERSPLHQTAPKIPVEVPSVLLERRPDISAAERLVAQANANIGVAIAAYFPVFPLTGTYGFDSNKLSKLFNYPAQLWSFGAQVAETILDGGLRDAKTQYACKAHEQAVANYRQTVLAAFQEVEDNLISLRQLNKEVIVQKEAVAQAELALKLTMDQYKSGTIAYTNVIVAQNTFFTAQKTAIDITGRQMVAAVLLVKALGGGWDDTQMKMCANPKK